MGCHRVGIRHFPQASVVWPRSSRARQDDPERWISKAPLPVLSKLSGVVASMPASYGVDASAHGGAYSAAQVAAFAVVGAYFGVCLGQVLDYSSCIKVLGFMRYLYGLSTYRSNSPSPEDIAFAVAQVSLARMIAIAGRDACQAAFPLELCRHLRWYVGPHQGIQLITILLMRGPGNRKGHSPFHAVHFSLDYKPWAIVWDVLGHGAYATTTTGQSKAAVALILLWGMFVRYLVAFANLLTNVGGSPFVLDGAGKIGWAFLRGLVTSCSAELGGTPLEVVGMVSCLNDNPVAAVIASVYVFSAYDKTREVLSTLVYGERRWGACGLQAWQCGTRDGCMAQGHPQGV